MSGRLPRPLPFSWVRPPRAATKRSFGISPPGCNFLLSALAHLNSTTSPFPATPLLPLPLSAKALDLFIKELMKSTTDIAISHGAKTVSPGHLRACMLANDKFDFLKDIVDGVPDLPVHAKKPTGSLSEVEGAVGASSALKRKKTKNDKRGFFSIFLSGCLTGAD